MDYKTVFFVSKLGMKWNLFEIQMLGRVSGKQIILFSWQWEVTFQCLKLLVCPGFTHQGCQNGKFIFFEHYVEKQSKQATENHLPPKRNSNAKT